MPLHLQRWLGTGHPDEVIGHHIVTTDSQGFITIDSYPSESAMMVAYRKLAGR